VMLEVCKSVDSESATFLDEGDNMFLKVVENRFSSALRHRCQLGALFGFKFGRLDDFYLFVSDSGMMVVVYESIGIKVIFY
jgi:hypothetical protein